MIFHCPEMTPWNVFNHFNYINKEIKYKGKIQKTYELVCLSDSF